MSAKWLKAKWWSWLGHRKARKGDYRSALIYFHRVLSLSPKSAYVHYYIGYCHSELGQHEEAVQAYDRALQIKPESAYARAQLGRSFVRLGRYRQGIEDLNRAFRMELKFKEDFNYQVALADAFTELGQIEEALDAYKELVRLDPQFAEAHYGVGWTLFRLENYKEAEQPLRTAIELNPDYAEAYNNLLHVLRALGKTTEARELDDQDGLKTVQAIRFSQGTSPVLFPSTLASRSGQSRGSGHLAAHAAPCRSSGG